MDRLRNFVKLIRDNPVILWVAFAIVVAFVMLVLAMLSSF